ncbi:hypothetical protein GGX14DRAFT_595924 [Mycena pura]|uniref:Uncharacterized protein n=1 Tax=Mycena pura TaxID=153505 RepID=A0AAD6UQ16_9AGAR|nr:hypothetical protein GGX14DRAFT_595924 [Mycena pura]
MSPHPHVGDVGTAINEQWNTNRVTQRCVVSVDGHCRAAVVLPCSNLERGKSLDRPHFAQQWQLLLERLARLLDSVVDQSRRESRARSASFLSLAPTCLSEGDTKIRWGTRHYHRLPGRRGAARGASWSTGAAARRTPGLHTGSSSLQKAGCAVTVEQDQLTAQDGDQTEECLFASGCHVPKYEPHARLEPLVGERDEGLPGLEDGAGRTGVSWPDSPHYDRLEEASAQRVRELGVARRTRKQHVQRRDNAFNDINLDTLKMLMGPSPTQH